jgi:lysophospholipase L1-like esterase
MSKPRNMHRKKAQSGTQKKRLRQDLSRGRRWVFRLLALSMILLPFLIVEVAARLAGYGGYPPVLNPLETVAGRTYVASYQPGVDSFFQRGVSITGGMQEQVFLSPAESGTFRVFCVGGSAMQGYPQPRMLGAPSFLQAMLSDAWPERDVEVVNLGTTAIASFPVMHILKEALYHDPDLVIIYSGNNEFYGAYGVASLHAFGRSTAAMRIVRALRALAAVQWLEIRLADSDKASASQEEDRRTLMERVVVEGQIDAGDRLRKAAAANLGRHLREMIHLCRQRGVPVLVSTLPANERDLWPIGEDREPSLPAAERTRFLGLLDEAEAGMSTDPENSIVTLQAALALYDRHARSHFLMARSLEAAGRQLEARASYARARELDTMPWRAPGSFNDVIREVAKTEGVVLSDLQRAFEASSPGGLIGWELMDDHVHPSLQGQALVARTWVRSMTELSGPLRIDPASVERLPDWSAYAERLGANRFDAFATARRMANLFEAPFYHRSNPEGLERFEEKIDQIVRPMKGAELEAIRYWRDPNTREQSSRPISGIAGAGLMTEGRYEEADRLLCIARRNVSPYSIWRLELTGMVLQCREKIHGRLRPEDLLLAEELVRDGMRLQQATGVSTPELERLMTQASDLLNYYRAKETPEATVEDPNFGVVE